MCKEKLKINKPELNSFIHLYVRQFILCEYLQVF